ncbi:BCAR3 [Cordylochernes scorpioides]|uniref:BCAR3 n=1 Tax=Cordylochernes scorpioides TaxID=51811 RepID=A0ABY6KPK2_9ARAC|nr:BCAR3 [Cordylochernes scorpioides]
MRRNSVSSDAKLAEEEEALRRALEQELSLDAADIRSHGWYHGTIPRQRAEVLLQAESEFLVRDCLSRPGDFVLSCRWRGACLHFIVNKVVFQPYTVYERVQYQFEEDGFDTVPDLVTFYVGNRKPVSAASGAIISRPVNRSLPLAYYSARFGDAASSGALQVEGHSADSVRVRATPPPAPSCLFATLRPRPASGIETELPQGDPPPKPRRLQTVECVADPVRHGVDLTGDLSAWSIKSEWSCPTLMPGDSRPLDPTILPTVRSLLIGGPPRVLAAHLTRADLELLGPGGVELITLPQGAGLRRDLTERSRALACLVAATVLTSADLAERVQLVEKWVQVALEAKTAMGNLFGFAALMAGLDKPQVSRLKQTWLCMRQTHTATAFTFETKLRPSLKAMREGREPQAPNTCVPYLGTLLGLMEGEEPSCPIGADFGLQTLLDQLEAARAWMGGSLASLLIRNRQALLSQPRWDASLLALFCPEFHLRLLWGTRGWAEPATDRYGKLDQVLDLLVLAKEGEVVMS